jgi:Acetyltransferases
MDYVVRKACENDSYGIAKTLAYSFEKNLSILTKDIECIARIFDNGVNTDRFYVAEQNGELIGVAACTDCETGRALKATKSDCVKHLGFIRGIIAFRFICSDLMRPLPYPETTSYIDVVGVLQQARGKGVAKKMLKTMIENNPQYNEFVLEADSKNTSAIKSYTDFGFVEFKREQFLIFVKRYRVFMRYTV